MKKGSKEEMEKSNEKRGLSEKPWFNFKGVRFEFISGFFSPIPLFPSPLHFSSLFSFLPFFNLYIYGPFAIIFRFMKCFPQYMPVNPSYHILCKEDILPRTGKRFSLNSPPKQKSNIKKNQKSFQKTLKKYPHFFRGLKGKGCGMRCLRSEWGRWFRSLYR